MTELTYQSYFDNGLRCAKRHGLFPLSAALFFSAATMEFQMAVTVWEPLSDDFGTLVQREFQSIDEAVRYAMEAIPECVRHVVVISQLDGSIIGPCEIHRHYSDLSAQPAAFAIEHCSSSASGAQRLSRSRHSGRDRFGVRRLMQRLRPAIGVRAAA